MKKLLYLTLLIFLVSCKSNYSFLLNPNPNANKTFGISISVLKKKKHLNTKQIYKKHYSKYEK